MDFGNVLIRPFVTLVLCLLATGCTQPPNPPPPAQTTHSPAGTPARPIPTLALTTRADTTLQLLALHVLNPDCTEAGLPNVEDFIPPANGGIRVTHEMSYSNFVQANQRYSCNLKKTANVTVRYKPNPGFTGQDSLQLRLTFPTGVVSMARFVITVQ